MERIEAGPIEVEALGETIVREQSSTGIVAGAPGYNSSTRSKRTSPWSVAGIPPFISSLMRRVIRPAPCGRSYTAPTIKQRCRHIVGQIVRKAFLRQPYALFFSSTTLGIIRMRKVCLDFYESFILLKIASDFHGSAPLPEQTEPFPPREFFRISSFRSPYSSSNPYDMRRFIHRSHEIIVLRSTPSSANIPAPFPRTSWATNPTAFAKPSTLPDIEHEQTNRMTTVV